MHYQSDRPLATLTEADHPLSVIPCRQPLAPLQATKILLLLMEENNPKRLLGKNRLEQARTYSARQDKEQTYTAHKLGQRRCQLSCWNLRSHISQRFCALPLKAVIGDVCFLIDLEGMRRDRRNHGLSGSPSWFPTHRSNWALADVALGGTPQRPATAEIRDQLKDDNIRSGNGTPLR